jgi:DNA recombination-dependent growth factor C
MEKTFTVEVWITNPSIGMDKATKGFTASSVKAKTALAAAKNAGDWAFIDLDNEDVQIVGATVIQDGTEKRSFYLIDEKGRFVKEKGTIKPDEK